MMNFQLYHIEYQLTLMKKLRERQVQETVGICYLSTTYDKEKIPNNYF